MATDDEEAFKIKLEEMLDKKRENVVIHSRQKLLAALQVLTSIQEGVPLTTEQSNLKRRYEILQVGGVQKLIRFEILAL